MMGFITQQRLVLEGWALLFKRGLYWRPLLFKRVQNSPTCPFVPPQPPLLTNFETDPPAQTQINEAGIAKAILGTNWIPVSELNKSVFLKRPLKITPTSGSCDVICTASGFEGQN